MQWLNRARRWLIIFSVLIVFALCFWSLGLAWIGNPPRVDLGLAGRSLKISAMRTIVTLDSLDPDTSTVVAHTSTSLDERSLIFEPNVQKEIPEIKNALEMPKKSEYQIYYLPPKISDLSPMFGLAGLRLIRQTVYPLKFELLKDSLQTEPPHDNNITLSVIGDPQYFPFDTYAIVYQLDTGALLEYRKSSANIESTNEVTTHFPGFVVRELFLNELESYIGSAGNELDQKSATKKQEADRKFWSGPGVAILVGRPPFLKLLTIILGAVAVISMFLLFRFSEPSKYFMNSLGTFAALWGVRSIITVGAPKTPNVVDFVTLALFVLQVGLVVGRGWYRREPDTEAD